jgi:hypothetical protein
MTRERLCKFAIMQCKYSVYIQHESVVRESYRKEDESNLAKPIYSSTTF